VEGTEPVEPVCGCGSVAEGKCRQCGRLFCAVHMGHMYMSRPNGTGFWAALADCCKECSDKQAAQNAAQRRRANLMAQGVIPTPPPPKLSDGTVEVLRELISRKVTGILMVKWRELTGAQLASLLPETVWTDIQVGTEIYGTFLRRERAVFKRGFVYESLDLTQYDARSTIRRNSILFQDGARVIGSDGLGWPNRQRPDKFVFPAHQVEQILAKCYPWIRVAPPRYP
jgi:hypothetical protein